MTCEHDLSEVTVVSRSEYHTAVEVEGPCGKCGDLLYGYVELEVIDR